MASRLRVSRHLQFSLVPVDMEFGLAAVIIRPASNATETRFVWICHRSMSDFADIFVFVFEIGKVQRLCVLVRLPSQASRMNVLEAAESWMLKCRRRQQYGGVELSMVGRRTTNVRGPLVACKGTLYWQNKGPTYTRSGGRR